METLYNITTLPTASELLQMDWLFKPPMRSLKIALHDHAQGTDTPSLWSVHGPLSLLLALCPKHKQS